MHSLPQARKLLPALTLVGFFIVTMGITSYTIAQEKVELPQTPLSGQAKYEKKKIVLSSFPTRYITNGPMLGKLTSSSIGVWARTKESGKFAVIYGMEETQLDQKSDWAETKIEDDNTGVVELTDLQPATEYFYQLVDPNGAVYRGGSFKTLPDPELLKDPEHNPEGLFNFRFEFACGNNQNPDGGLGPSLPTYDTLLKQVLGKVDFAILNGDWLYEKDRDYSPRLWKFQTGMRSKPLPGLVSIAPTIVGVWQNYKAFLKARNLAQWHRHVPSYYTFDDHEILNDVFGTGTAGYRNRRAVFRDIGIAAWYDYLGWSNPQEFTQPIHFGKGEFKEGSDILTDPEADFTKIDLKKAANLHVHWGTDDAGVKDIPTGDTEGGDPNANVYDIVEILDAHRVRISPKAAADGTASYSIGRRSYGSFRVSNCQFYFVDTRTHRDLHNLSKPEDPDLSMLGDQQTEWLLKSIKESDAAFHFVVSSVNFMVPHVGGGGVDFDTELKDDAWTAFLHEREKLIEAFDAVGTPVFILTGDLHNSFAVKITDRVWEFASGPHNSVNHRPEDEGGRPVNGYFKYGPRSCEIRWSTIAMEDIPRENRMFPHYCVVQINNVFNNPLERDGKRMIAYPHPQVIFQYYNGLTGELAYSETITTPMKPPKKK
ncbi:Secreted alkaline phosphatase [Planctomycetales bacterium 10988]|nr:Secreted alkaline phosphatase [Planctomycetales bacterium 10988]